MDFKIKIPKKMIPWIASAGVVTATAAVGVATILHNNNQPVAPKEEIVLSILDELSFTAENRTQDVLLINPADNSYDLVITFLDEKGKVIFTSEMLKPGSQQKSIQLSRTVNPDESTFTVVYDCMENQKAVETVQVETAVNVQ